MLGTVLSSLDGPSTLSGPDGWVKTGKMKEKSQDFMSLLKNGGAHFQARRIEENGEQMS